MGTFLPILTHVFVPLSPNALWADWVVRNAFERSPLPKAKKISFLFLIAKRLKFWTSLERILISS